MNPLPPSPCNQTCVLDQRAGFCVGCFRTGGEIATWQAQNAAERHATLAACARRRAASPLLPGGEQAGKLGYKG